MWSVPGRLIMAGLLSEKTEAWPGGGEAPSGFEKIDQGSGSSPGFLSHAACFVHTGY